MYVRKDVRNFLPNRRGNLFGKYGSKLHTFLGPVDRFAGLAGLPVWPVEPVGFWGLGAFAAAENELERREGSSAMK